MEIVEIKRKKRKTKRWWRKCPFTIPVETSSQVNSLSSCILLAIQLVPCRFCLYYVNDSFSRVGSGLTVSACRRVEMLACLSSPLLSIRIELHVMPLSFPKPPLLVYRCATLSFNTSVAEPSTLRVMYHTIGVVGQRVFYSWKHCRMAGYDAPLPPLV